jgi:transcriptional regulator with XRE-family HTH domain
VSDEPFRCDCKIGRDAEKYGVPDLPLFVRRRRLEDGLSLRDLAEAVNTRLVESVLEEADADVAGDAASVYAALADEDVPPERRLSVRNRLTDLGVDVEELDADFVSYQAVRRHLRNCLDVATDREGITDLSEGREIVATARERDREIISQTLRRLQRVGELRDTDIEVRISPRVSCRRCGQFFGLDEFLAAGGCDCATARDDR